MCVNSNGGRILHATVIHLSTSLVWSKSAYAQEVFFNAPKLLLTKLKSVDGKGYKLAFGVPVHASCMGTYREVGLLPLDDFRQFASAKYEFRSSTIINSNGIEVSLQYKNKNSKINEVNQNTQEVKMNAF